MGHTFITGISHSRRGSPFAFRLTNRRFSQGGSRRCGPSASVLCYIVRGYWSLVLVVNATSLSRSGVADFLLQRVSAVFLAVYAGCIVWFVLANPELDYRQWEIFMGAPGMLILGTLTLLSWGIHAWIGMWTVGTDYLTEHHIGKFATVLRLVYQFGVTSLIIVYFVLGFVIIW